MNRNIITKADAERVNRERVADARRRAREDMQSALEHLQQECFRISAEHGFHDDDAERNKVDQKMMLVVGEVAEAHEALREGSDPGRKWFLCKSCGREQPDGVRDCCRSPDLKPEGVGVELADAVIRILDLAEMVGVDLAELIIEKMQYNESRPRMHGNKMF